MYTPPTELRQISSRLTFITKFISPFATLIAAAFVLIPIFAPPFIDKLPILGFFVVFVSAIAGHHLWTAYRIKSVKADSTNLYVSNYFKETQIPFSEIANVTEFRWVEPHTVTIHLRTPSEFGQKIAFLAPYRLIGGWTPHPIVEELKQMAGQNIYKEIKDSWLT
jgi:hypothetical protein